MKRATKPAPTATPPPPRTNKAVAPALNASCVAVTLCPEAAAVLRAEMEMEASLRAQVAFIHKVIADEILHHRLSESSGDDIAWTRIAKAAGATDQILFGLTVDPFTANDISLQ